MSKYKNYLIYGVALAIAVGGGLTGYFLLGGKSKTTGQSLNIVDTLSQAVKPEVKGELTFEDPAGFSFMYPKGVKVEDITPNDNIYYTLLEVSKENQKIRITAKDTSVSTPDAWVNSPEAPKNLDLSGATSLAGISAKQYTSSDKLYTVSVDEGILYLIEGPKDGGFWEETQNVIVATFAFVGTKPAGAGAGSDNAIYEEEEIVE